jgi:hypothetical protein
VQDLLIKMGINPAEIQFELVDDVNSKSAGDRTRESLLAGEDAEWLEGRLRRGVYQPECKHHGE